MNRRSKWMMVVLVAALIGAAPVAARPAVGAAAIELAVATWETVAASGQVEARSATAEQADWRHVRRGDALRPQTLVQTGDKGRATLTRNANLLMLDPSSRVELPGQGFSGMETSVIQTEGSVLYNVDSRINPHFEVVTPYLVAGVKGTSFLVTVNEDYASVTVEHGLVEVTNPASGEVREVGAGESIVLHRGQLEMDVQYDTRPSRQARKESKHLKRMVRRRDELNVDGSTGLVADNGLNSSDTNDNDPLFGQTGLTNDGHGVGLDIDELTQELIKEMIREDIRVGRLN